MNNRSLFLSITRREKIVVLSSCDVTQTITKFEEEMKYELVERDLAELGIVIVSIR